MTTVDARPVLVGTFEVASVEWHAARADGIGGSEISAVLGLSRYESRFSLWHRKAGRIPPQAENNEMEAGKRLEPVICDKFADDHPEYVVLPAGTYRHPERPWQIANPDRLLKTPCACGAHHDGPTRSNGMAFCCDPDDCGPCCPDCPSCPTLGHHAVALLEAKFALYPDDWGTEGTAEIPPYYLAQTRWYLDVFGLDTCYVEVFIGAIAEFRTYVVHPDDTDAATMRDAAAEFMRTITADERPDIDAHSATYEAVRELHPDIEPVDYELDTETARAFCSARERLDAAEAEAQRTKSLLADAMGNAKRAVYLGRNIAGRQSKNGGVPYVVAARNLPTFTEDTP